MTCRLGFLPKAKKLSVRQNPEVRNQKSETKALLISDFFFLSLVLNLKRENILKENTAQGRVI